MNTVATETRTVTVERELPFAPDRVWRALTQPHLIAEWLMKNDFALALGHVFTLSGDWGSVSCKVLEIETNKSLSYTWGGMGLESVVTLTLTPTDGGTHLRMDQTGFRPDQPQNYNGAKFGWQKFLAQLEGVLSKNG